MSGSIPWRVGTTTAAVLVISTLALTGCGAGEDKPANPIASSTSAASTPTPAPSPTQSLASLGQAPDISKYEAMTLEEFTALASDEQMIYGAGKLVPGLVAFADTYHSISKNPLDVLPKGSVDNTAQEIATQVAYSLRYALSLQPEEREKFILAILRNDSQSTFYPIIEGLSTQGNDVALPAGAIANLDIIYPGNNASMGDLQEDTNHDKFRQIAVTGEDGSAGSYNAYFVEIPLPDGTSFKTWIRE